MDLVGGEDVRTDRVGNRIEQPGRLSDPVAERRAVEIDAVAGEDLGLAIERQVVAVLRPPADVRGWPALRARAASAWAAAGPG